MPFIAAFVVGAAVAVIIDLALNGGGVTYIPAGSSGTITHQVRIDGRWLAEDRVRAAGMTIPRGVKRRARLPYRTANGERREITVGGPTRGACETATRARLTD